jgi:type II secretory pathway component PulF
MEFTYEALDTQGKAQSGIVNAVSQEAAIASLQAKGFTITAISNPENAGLQKYLSSIPFFTGVSNKDVVMLSRQISTLFEAQVSALRVFRMLSEQAEKPALRAILADISDSLQAGSSISESLTRHQDVFSSFYVNMVRAGEESGKLDQTFQFLADYIERSYELTSKARNALVYPAFIMATFVAVMTLMLTVVIPKIGEILEGDGQQLPVYTRIILGLSHFLVDYGIFVFIALVIGGYFIYRYSKTPQGSLGLSHLKLSIPYVGNLYRKLYLARFCDNMNVMLSSGITAVRALEITSTVIENDLYSQILLEALEGVKAGNTMSSMLARYPSEMPVIVIQMLQIGEETGEMSSILQRLAKFYNREVNTAVDTLVSLIEPALIILLALGVGFLLASVLLPIYNSTTSI